MRLATLVLYFVFTWACNSTPVPQVGQHKNILRWTPVSTYIDGTPCTSNVKYLVYRSINNINYSVVATLPLNTPTWTDTSAQPNKVYWYKVSAFDSATSAYSGYSNTLKCTTMNSCIAQ